MVRGLAVVALVCMATAIALGIARPWSSGAANGLTASSSLRPGGFLVVVHNDSGDVVRIAQVTVDDAFVGFSAKRLALAPRGRTQLEIDYSWIRGEPYEIGVLTSTGAIVQTQVGGAQDS